MLLDSACIQACIIYLELLDVEGEEGGFVFRLVGELLQFGLHELARLGPRSRELQNGLMKFGRGERD
jgi:hypothetical protein